jgi:hypothetical protein
LGSLNDDIKDDSEEYPRMVGMSKWLQLEAEAATANIFPDVGVDWARMEPEARTCSHEWAIYQGLNEKYEFCKKCDEKK